MVNDLRNRELQHYRGILAFAVPQQPLWLQCFARLRNCSGWRCGPSMHSPSLSYVFRVQLQMFCQEWTFFAKAAVPKANLFERSMHELKMIMCPVCALEEEEEEQVLLLHLRFAAFGHLAHALWAVSLTCYLHLGAAVFS